MDDARHEPGFTTLPSSMSKADLRRARRIRRSTLGLLIVLSLLGVTGSLGGRTGAASASANGYDLQVEYTQIVRSGLSADGSVRVTWRAGVPPARTVAITEDYLGLFDGQVVPAPTVQTSAPPYVHYTFATPPGDTLDVSVAADVTAGLDRVGVEDVEVVVLVGGAPVVRTSFRVWVVP